MLTAFGPNPATIFLSWRGGAQASSSPRQDDFREVFKGRLQARLASRSRVTQEAETRKGSWRNRVTARAQTKTDEPKFRLESESRSPQQVDGPEKKNRQQETQRTRKQKESPAAVAAPAGETSQPVASSRAQAEGANSASPPQALQDLIAFLQTQPNSSLKIAPEQIPAVASYLMSAGLPREEVEQLLMSPDFAEKGLSAADLQAAWQRTQGQAAAAELGAESLAKPAAPAGQSQPGPNLASETQDMLQTPEHRSRWERATVPESALPALRLALARLGVSPQELAQLEEEAQGQGLPLSRVLQTLQQAPNRLAQAAVSEQNRTFSEENLSQAAMLQKQPVTAEEVAEWRQLLLKAGLEPQVVEKMLGQSPPASQEDLKTTLMALAPPEEPAQVLADPKPLYLPENLRSRPVFPQGRSTWDQSDLNGQGNGDTPYGSGMEWAAEAGETFALPAFTGQLPMFNPNVNGAAALSNTAPLWNPVAPEVRESLWSQLQSGIISNLQPGENQVSLRLNPPKMGQIQLTLNLNGQELTVTAVASRPEVAELANQGVQQLMQALAQQGLVLTHFQVRLQDQPQGLTTVAQSGGREKPGESAGERFPASTRRLSGEVDRFV